MFDICRVEREIGGKVLSIETGKIAKQADGAVMVRYGDTMVLVTACSSAAREDIDYFPLMVDYREKLSAAGKFPGGFIKREGRPSTKEILTARMIDRPIRPLFPDGYFNEVQILCSVLSADQENDPDVITMIGASAALSISSIPFQGPLGACRLSRVDGEYKMFPTYTEREKSDFNLVLGGRKEAINMIEVDAKEVPEAETGQAIAAAHEIIGSICDLIEELREKCGKVKVFETAEIEPEMLQMVEDRFGNEFYEANKITDKLERQQANQVIREKIVEAFCTAQEEGQEPAIPPNLIKRIIEKVEKGAVRKILLEGKRPDGRKYDEIRPINCEVGILPRAHGSALFTRGETQALVTCTLGTGQDAQIIDGLLEEYGQRFMLHYNFPPSSVGEVRFIRGPGRREIGHGALAEKALEALAPDVEEFGYTVKINSDITESNGSSSMASVCGGCLAMMDAGVPIARPIAGISVGMITTDDNTRYELLTDIIGDEDHFGDMDFKIAGTTKGITAIQLDIKADGLPHDIMVEALERGRQARMKLLDIMTSVIPEPRTTMSEYAPRLTTIKIDPEFIGKVIGPAGKMIKSIQEQTNSVIEIEEDGTVMISSTGHEGYMEARDIIEAMTTPPEVGKIYKKSKVVSVKDFGVFVEIVPGVEGLCHISELDEGFVKNVEDVCKVGDIIAVKLLLIDNQGRFKLSRKAALAEMKESEETDQTDKEDKVGASEK